MSAESDNKTISLRVLVLEDDPHVALVCRRMLERLGHSVQSASDGCEALRQFSAALRQGRPFDVQIFDLQVTHGLGGAKTLEQVFQLAPEAQAIAATGDCGMDELSVRQLGFAALLEKPYTLNNLRQVLDSLKLPHLTEPPPRPMVEVRSGSET